MQKQQYDYSLDRGLPQSIETERAVIGAVFIDNSSYYEIADSIVVEDFALDSHRRIFLAMQSLAENSAPIDFITITDVLERKKELESVGGHAYLCSITDGIPKRQNLKWHVDILKEKSTLRQLIHAGSSFVQKAYEQTEDTKDILAVAEESVMRIAEQRISNGLADIGTIVTDDFGSLQKLFERGQRITGLETHFEEFDNLTSGLQDAELIIIAARPSVGKTAFAVNVAENCAIKDKKVVAMFSLEMKRGALVQRMLCSHARVDSHKFRTGFLGREDYAKLNVAMSELIESKIFIDDQSALSISELRAKCRKFIQRYGRLDLIIVDYLQLMHGGRKFENRTQEVSAISRGLKLLAKELNCPIMALSQLSRLVESRQDKRPMLSDLRDSGSLEQDADVVGFLYRPELYYPDNPELQGLAELILSKQRNGAIGTIPLTYLKQLTRFESRQLTYD